MQLAVSTRAVAVLVAGLTGLVGIAVVVRHLGDTSYGVLTLVITLPALVPFADLGVGTGITNLVAGADDAASRRAALAAVRRGGRFLALAGIAVVAVAVSLAATDAWPRLLGTHHVDHGVAGSVVLIAVAFAVSLPLGLGERVLLGFQRAAVNYVVQIARSGFVLCGLVAVASSPWSGSVWAYTTVYAIALFGAPLASSVVAWRELHGRGWLAPHAPAVVSPALAPHALPAFIGTVAHAVAYQSDRVVISHVLGPIEVAVYSLAGSLYAPAYAIVAAVGVAAWPAIEHARASGDAGWARSLFLKGTRWAGAGAVVVALGFAVTGPFVAAVLAGGRVDTPPVLYLAFALLLAVQLIVQPAIGMLMQPAGLRVQAGAITAMAVVNLPLSVLLTGWMGPSGPVWASVATTGGIYVPVLVWRAWRLDAARGAVPDLPAAPPEMGP